MSRSCKQRSDYHQQIVAHLPNPAAVERYHNTIMKLPEQAPSAPGTKDHYLVQLKRLVKDEFRLGDRADYKHNTCVVPAPADVPVNDMPYQLITSPAHTAVLDKQPLRANVIRRYNTDNNYYDSDPRSMIISAYDDTYGNSFGDPPLEDVHGQRPGSPGGGGCCCGCGDSRMPRPNAEMLFYGWIGQHVGDHDRYPYHVRKVKIVFYCDDGTIEVIEPYEQDGGRKQQIFLSRQLMPKADSPGSNYELKDFILGVWHTYYAHRIQICDAHEDTKQTLEAMGYILGEPAPIPGDKFISERVATKFAKTHQTYHVPNHKEFDKRWRSQALSGIVLRFFAILDERSMPYGLIRKAEIHFFVEDGTIEVTEPMVKNDGRNPATSRIIRRTHVPRSGLSAPTDIPQFDMSKIISELALVTEDDIKVGQNVKLFSRTYFVYDVDGFTRRYFDDKQKPQPAAVDWEEVVFPNRKLRLAQIKNEREANERRQFAEEVNSPGGGILPLLEAPVSFDMAKQRRMASAAKQLNYGDKKLTFSAQLLNCKNDAALQTPVTDGTHDYMVPFASPNPPVAGGDRNNSSENVASRRTFVISICVSSDLVTVFELRRNNSGFKGGTMFGPHKVPKYPKELCLQTERRAVQQEWRANPVYLSLQDFYVGAIIDVHGYNFRLLACDEPTVEFCSQCSPALWSPEKVQAMQTSAEEAKQHPVKYEHGFFDHYVGARKGEFIRCEDDLDYITDRVVLDLREKALQRRINIWRAYLCYDNARQAYLDAPAIKRALQYMNLPSDDDIVREIIRRARLVYAAEGPGAARNARQRDLNNCLTDYSMLENDNDVKTLHDLRAFEASNTSFKNSGRTDTIRFEEFNALIENSQGATWRSVMAGHPCIPGPLGPREGYLYNTDLPYIHYEPDPKAAGSRFVYKNENIPGGLF